MKYIKIVNEGLIDKMAFTLIGASTKREDRKKIGFFGSGLKYAMAVLLKHNNNFKIFSGLKEITLSTKKVKFREQTFDVIHINGRKTNLTTDMGVDWEQWFSVREIYCNALDENNGSIEEVNEIVPAENTTTFFIEINPDLQKLLDNWNLYFSNKRTDLLCYDGETRIFNGNKNLTVYRKGIQCHHIKIPSLFDYDLSWIKINESRTIKDTWDLTYYLPEKIAMIANSDVIIRLFNGICGIGNNSYYEEGMCWDSHSNYNSVWLDVIGNRKLVNKDVAGYFQDKIANEDILILPYKLIKGLQSAFGDKIQTLGQSDWRGFTVIDKEAKQIALLDQCIAFLDNAGFKLKYPVKIAIFKDKDTLGSVNGNDIILSTGVFDTGKKKIVETILEETFHIESGKKDLTRSFQDLLITKFVGLLEEKAKVYL